MDRVNRIVYSISLIVFARRLPSLFHTCSPSGTKFALLLLSIAILRPYEQKTKLTLVSVGVGMLCSYYFQSNQVLRGVVALGGAPVVAEALRMQDADIPAVLAMILGLALVREICCCLRHAHHHLLNPGSGSRRKCDFNHGNWRRGVGRECSKSCGIGIAFIVGEKSRECTA